MMVEILVQGNIEEDLKRLGIKATRTYGNEYTDYQVYELSKEEYEKLSNDADERDIEDGFWLHGGWRWAEGSNMGNPNTRMTVRGEELVCWEKEWNGMQEDEYKDLLTYLCNEIGASAFRNVCALAVDLAKWNNMTMAQLFEKYQGYASISGEVEPPKENTIVVKNDDGTVATTVQATDDGKVLVDGKEVESVEQANVVLNLIIKALSSMVR